MLLQHCPSMWIALLFLGRASYCAAEVLSQTAPPQNRFTSAPGEETADAKNLIDSAAASLASGKRATELLIDPAFLPVHEWPRFRQLIRSAADSAGTTIVTPAEPGTPLVVTGRVLRQNGRPIRSALV